jgi:hypothetical protein
MSQLLAYFVGHVVPDALKALEIACEEFKPELSIEASLPHI